MLVDAGWLLGWFSTELAIPVAIWYILWPHMKLQRNGSRG